MARKGKLNSLMWQKKKKSDKKNAKPLHLQESTVKTPGDLLEYAGAYLTRTQTAVTVACD